jgi:Serine/threonine protein kinase
MGTSHSKQPPLLTDPAVVPQSQQHEPQKEEDDDEDTGICSNVFPCFSLFCPALSSSSSSSNASRRRRGRDRKNDPLGSPMPPTPKMHKPKRQIYGGLEAEDSTSMSSGGGGRLGMSSTGMTATAAIGVGATYGGNYQRSNSNRSYNSRCVIYSGDDGEQRLMKKYQMCEVLGVGSTSVCHRCVDRNTGRSFACKIIDKVQIEQRFEGMIDQFHTEIEALKSLNHPNIIKLYDVYTTSNKIYIVMELMAGGELFDYVVKKGTLTEAEASIIVRMVTSALVYMHGQNIMHRDLKPENLLLTHAPKSVHDIEVKIIDFGLSKVSECVYLCRDR